MLESGSKKYDEKEHLPTRTEKSSRKVHYEDKERAALNAMPAPFMLTLTGRKRFSVYEWLDLVGDAIRKNCRGGLDLRIDAFKQPRDRSVHLAIWNLPRHRELELTAAIEKERRSACAFASKPRKSKDGKRKDPLFLVAGLNLAYLWAHEEIASAAVKT